MSDGITWPKAQKRTPAGQRARIETELRKKYDAGASIRAIAEETGRSYGWIHGVLGDAGVIFRQRGGKSSTPRGTRTRASQHPH